jgi:hypothetical protein
MSRRRSLSCVLVVILLAGFCYAKDAPVQVIVWPESGAPLLRFSFKKFKEIGSVGNERTFMIDTTVENLWGKKISNANFALYLFDKNKVRIGQGVIALSGVGVGESVKFQTTIAAAGAPTLVSLEATYLPTEFGPVRPPRTVSMTVNSVPQGALVKLDGEEAGTTPKMVRLGIGKHLLEFNKDGFNPGKFPLEIGPDDVSGGSVSYELGTSAHDTIELRDGTVVGGDLESVSATAVVVRAGGKDISYDRNQVKKIMMVERESLPALPAAVTQPQ